MFVLNSVGSSPVTCWLAQKISAWILPHRRYKTQPLCCGSPGCSGFNRLVVPPRWFEEIISLTPVCAQRRSTYCVKPRRRRLGWEERDAFMKRTRVSRMQNSVAKTPMKQDGDRLSAKRKRWILGSLSQDFKTVNTRLFVCSRRSSISLKRQCGSIRTTFCTWDEDLFDVFWNTKKQHTPAKNKNNPMEGERGNAFVVLWQTPSNGPSTTNHNQPSFCFIGNSKI